MDSDRRAASEGTGSGSGRRAVLLRYGLGLAALGVVAFFFVRQRTLFVGFGDALADLNWVWVVVAFAAELASVPPLAEAQRKVLAAAGVASDRVQMNLVTLASNAISASVPAGVAVAEGYSFVRYRRFGANTAVAAWSELAIGAINFCALATLALAGAVIAGGGAESVLLPLLGVVVAGSGGAALLFRYPRFMLRTVGWTEVHLGRVGSLVGRLTQGFCRTARSLGHVHPSIGLWSAAWGLSLVNWLLDALCLALTFAAVHAPIPWGAVLLAFAGAKVVSSIGITPGGLGVVEAGLVATFVAYGVQGAHAGAAVLVYRVLTLIGLVGIGWLSVALLALGDRRRARSSHEPELAMEPAKSARQRREDP